ADLAPTFLAWMGAPAMGADGRSLDPLLRGSGGSWRQAMPITHERMGSAPNVPTWQGVRTTRYAYWKYQGGAAQLYDMTQDPGQALVGPGPVPGGWRGEIRTSCRCRHDDRLPLERLAALIKARWACEQLHQQLEDELGLDHFEGRSWRGLHHHALLCLLAFF